LKLRAATLARAVLKENELERLSGCFGVGLEGIGDAPDSEGPVGSSG